MPTAIGKPGTARRKVIPEEIIEWRRLILEERMTYRAVGRQFGRTHRVVQYYVQESPPGGAIQHKSSGWKKKPRPRTPSTELAKVMYMARNRSRENKWEFSITLPMMEVVYAAQDGRCALTGIPFQLDRPPKNSGRTYPFRPSIDRIDNNIGYTENNVRLVLWGINAAMNAWGENVYAQIAEAYFNHRGQPKDSGLKA